MSERSQSQWLELVLAQLKSDMGKLDDRQQQYLQESASRGQMLETLNANVEKLTQIVSTGNGTPSLKEQVSRLTHDVRQIHSATSKLATDMAEVKKLVQTRSTPAQKAEKWKAAGIIVGGILAFIPGMLALFGVTFGH